MFSGGRAIALHTSANGEGEGKRKEEKGERREKKKRTGRKSGEKKSEKRKRGEEGKAGKDFPLKPRRTEFKSSLNPAGRERVSLKP